MPSCCRCTYIQVYVHIHVAVTSLCRQVCALLRRLGVPSATGGRQGGIVQGGVVPSDLVGGPGALGRGRALCVSLGGTVGSCGDGVVFGFFLIRVRTLGGVIAFAVTFVLVVTVTGTGLDTFFGSGARGGSFGLGDGLEVLAPVVAGQAGVGVLHAGRLGRTGCG